MKKFLAIFGLMAIMMAPVLANNDEAAFCITPKGELLGTINQLEADGFVVTDISCQPINYLVQPEPPYVNAIISVTMRKFVCGPNPEDPCALLGTASFTADEVVINDNGNTQHTNVSQIFVAL